VAVIGFIGLGRMGYAMASRLRDRGFELVVWNRSRWKAEKFSKEYGATIASSPAELASKTSIVHLMVADDNASRQVILGARGILEAARPGLLVVEHSTITPSHSRFIEKILARRETGYAEAPVIGGPRRAASGELLVLVAGDRRAVEASKPLGETLYLGGVPRASAAKLAFNNLLFTVIAGIAETASLLEAYSIDFEWFSKTILSKTFLKTIVERYGRRPFDENYPTSFAAKLAGKDEAYFAEALREKSLPAIHATSIAQLYSLMDSEGWGERDYTHLALYLLKKAKKSTLTTEHAEKPRR